MRDKVTKITRSMKRITALLTLFLAMTFISCKSGKTVGENPFFAEWETPYGVPPFDKIEPEHFLPAIERGMSLHEAEIDAITSNNDAPTFENVILAYDASGKMLSQVELIFGMLCAAENTSEMQALEEQIMPRMAAHADKIRLNGKLFERIKAVYDRRAALGLDAEQSRLLEKTYRSFVRAGALLDAERKARLKAINEELSLTAVKFGQNLLAENNNYALELASSDLDGIPATARDLAREKAEAMGRKGKYVFTLHKPSLIPFLTYSSKRELREQIYKAYLNRCNNGDEYDNKQLINDFIRLRTEKAHLLGYPSYAAYVVDDEMAGTTDAVYGLLEEIWTPALESAKGELAEMDECMPHYYKVTNNHGQGAETIMRAEALFCQGHFTDAHIELERAYAQVRDNGQINMALCCDFLSRRLSLHTDVEQRYTFAERYAELLQYHDASWINIWCATSAYYHALRGEAEEIPEIFSQHRLSTVNMLAPGKPMMEMIDKLNERGEEVIFLGDGVPVFAKMIQENLKVPYSFAPAHVNKQRAAAVAALGALYAKEGKVVTAMEHVPEYLRVSQAERERAQKLKEQEAAGEAAKNEVQP